MPHLNDDILVMHIDGELDARTAADAAAHLAVCRDCAARRADFLAAGEAYAKSTQELRWSYAGVAAIALAAAGMFLLPQGEVHAAYLPDSRLTPGATSPVTTEQVCIVERESDIPESLARRVFAQYRIDRPAPRAYEVDYLISPALGGAEDIRNLWPQPYRGSEWTANVKDALEDHLRELVCSGKLSLADAQRDIATDWVAAYRKYFQTARPLPAHVAFLKDRPWE
jgi:hypothetical protein